MESAARWLALASAAPLACCGPSASPAASGGAAGSPGAGAVGAGAGTAPADSIYFGQREVPARTPGAVRIATYNLLNLFDDEDDPALSGPVEDIDDATPAARRQCLAGTIRRLDADVLALQEVESDSALREFRDGYLGGLGYDYLVSLDTGDPRGIECAVLSRFPVANIEHWAGQELGGVHPAMWGSQPNDWAGESITFKRSPLRVDVLVPVAGSEADGASPYVLTLFVMHSKSGGPGAYWREAESSRLVEIVGAVRAEDPGANIVVLGDFNATSDQRSVRLLLEADLTEVLPFDAGRATATASHESGRRIDHILMSPGALREVVRGSEFILGTPGRPPGADWRATPAPEGLASDHYPVVVELWAVDR